jgi:hypothetical protein
MLNALEKEVLLNEVITDYLEKLCQIKFFGILEFYLN